MYPFFFWRKKKRCALCITQFFFKERKKKGRKKCSWIFFYKKQREKQKEKRIFFFKFFFLSLHNSLWKIQKMKFYSKCLVIYRIVHFHLMSLWENLLKQNLLFCGCDWLPLIVFLLFFSTFLRAFIEFFFFECSYALLFFFEKNALEEKKCA